MFKPTPRKPPPATARAPARPPNRAAVLRQKSKEKINKITTVIGVPLSARFSGAEPPRVIMRGEAGEIQAVATMVPVIVQGQAMSEPPPNSDNMPRV